MSGWCRKARGQSAGPTRCRSRTLIGLRRCPSSSQRPFPGVGAFPRFGSFHLFVGSCSACSTVVVMYGMRTVRVHSTVTRPSASAALSLPMPVTVRKASYQLQLQHRESCVVLVVPAFRRCPRRACPKVPATTAATSHCTSNRSHKVMDICSTRKQQIQQVVSLWADVTVLVRAWRPQKNRYRRSVRSSFQRCRAGPPKAAPASQGQWTTAVFRSSSCSVASPEPCVVACARSP